MIQLNSNKIWKIITFFGWPWIVILILLILFLTNFDQQVAFVLILSLFLEDLIGVAIKALFYKPRPKPQNFSNFLQKIDAWSFPSIHTSRSFVIAITSCLFLPIFECIFFVILAWLIAYSRIHLQRHFWIDILWWAVIAIFSILVATNIFALI